MPPPSPMISLLSSSWDIAFSVSHPCSATASNNSPFISILVRTSSNSDSIPSEYAAAFLLFLLRVVARVLVARRLGVAEGLEYRVAVHDLTSELLRRLGVRTAPYQVVHQLPARRRVRVRVIAQWAGSGSGSRVQGQVQGQVQVQGQG